MNSEPALWIIAGPDGVGKTTYAFKHIRAVAGTVRFVNMDEIARGLSPLDPAAEQRSAARIALARIDEPIATRVSFSLETTLSGRTHLTAIAAAKAHGFRVHLLFFAVAAVEICLSRVAKRVSEEGHAVAEIDIRRRFERASRNIAVYAPLCDLQRIYDNNGPLPKVVAEGRGPCVAMRGTTGGLPTTLVDALAIMPVCREA